MHCISRHRPAPKLHGKSIWYAYFFIEGAKSLTFRSVRAGMQLLDGEVQRQTSIIAQEKRVILAARQSPDVDQPDSEAAQAVVQSARKM